MQPRDGQDTDTRSLAQRQEALFPGNVSDFPAIADYAAFVGLPQQAIPAIMLAVQMRRQLTTRCEAQWKLLKFPGEAAKYIQSAKPLNPWQIAKSGQYAKEQGLPLDCIYAMETRQRFSNGILSGGYRLLAQADPRILKSAGAIDIQQGVIETRQSIPGSKSGEQLTSTIPWVKVTYKVVFWNGEEYIGVGMADGNDDAIKQRGTSQMPAIAETRAANHAYRAALRMVGPGGGDFGGEEAEAEE